MNIASYNLYTTCRVKEDKYVDRRT